MEARFDDRTVQGAKIALIREGEVVTYLRDNIAEIPDPNRWDLPGGVREERETAIECALRETREEFGLEVSQDRVFHASDYVALNPRRRVMFFAAEITPGDIAAIRFGDEGQCWQMMPVGKFCSLPDAVVELQEALRALNLCGKGSG